MTADRSWSAKKSCSRVSSPTFSYVGYWQLAVVLIGKMLWERNVEDVEGVAMTLLVWDQAE